MDKVVQICSLKWQVSKTLSKCKQTSRQLQAWCRISKELPLVANPRMLKCCRDRLASNSVMVSHRMHRWCQCQIRFNSISNNSEILGFMSKIFCKRELILKKLDNTLTKLLCNAQLNLETLQVLVIKILRWWNRTWHNNSLLIHKWSRHAFKKINKRLNKATVRGSNAARKWHMNTACSYSKPQEDTKSIFLSLVNLKKPSSCYLKKDTRGWMK